MQDFNKKQFNYIKKGDKLINESGADVIVERVYNKHGRGDVSVKIPTVSTKAYNQNDYRYVTFIDIKDRFDKIEPAN